MYGLAMMVVMSLSGHLSDINYILITNIYFTDTYSWIVQMSTVTLDFHFSHPKFARFVYFEYIIDFG